jgi:hypothetical protein
VACPLYPRKRTRTQRDGASASGHNRTCCDGRVAQGLNYWALTDMKTGLFQSLNGVHYLQPTRLVMDQL